MSGSTHFSRYRMTIEPLSPIHIGSGQTIEPYEYAVRARGGNYFLIVLDLPALMRGLSEAERREYYEVINKGDFPGLRAWLSQRADTAAHRRCVIQVQESAAPDLLANQNNPDRLGEIHLFTRDPGTGRPFIPGSSVKGAIRTAVLDELARKGDERQLLAVAEQCWPSDGRSGRRVSPSALFEAEVLGNVDRGRPDHYRDPFRQLAIADAPLPEDACYIDRVQIVRRVGSDNRRAPEEGIQMHRDMTWSVVDGAPTTAHADVRLISSLAEPGTMREKRMPVPLTVGGLCAACNAYYVEELEAQLDEFTPRDPRMDAEVRDPLLAAAGNLAANQCVVRLGRHSHWECTVISRPFNKPPRRGYGKTRSYAGGELPMGWARLTLEETR